LLRQYVFLSDSCTSCDDPVMLDGATGGFIFDNRRDAANQLDITEYSKETSDEQQNICPRQAAYRARGNCPVARMVPARRRTGRRARRFRILDSGSSANRPVDRRTSGSSPYFSAARRSRLISRWNHPPLSRLIPRWKMLELDGGRPSLYSATQLNEVGARSVPPLARGPSSTHSFIYPSSLLTAADFKSLSCESNSFI
jgi:hypothetical protein